MAVKSKQREEVNTKGERSGPKDMDNKNKHRAHGDDKTGRESLAASRGQMSQLMTYAGAFFISPVNRHWTEYSEEAFNDSAGLWLMTKHIRREKLQLRFEF